MPSGGVHPIKAPSSATGSTTACPDSAFFGGAVFASAGFRVAEPDPEVYRLRLAELAAAAAAERSAKDGAARQERLL